MLATLGLGLALSAADDRLLIEEMTNRIDTADSRRRAGSNCQWKRTVNAAIYGHNIEHLERTSVDGCKRACEARDWCRSFDYYKIYIACDLSDQHPDSVQLKTDYENNPYDNYALYCSEEVEDDLPTCNGSNCSKWLADTGRFDRRGWVSSNGSLGEVCINGNKWWYIISTNGQLYSGEKNETCGQPRIPTCNGSDCQEWLVKTGRLDRRGWVSSNGSLGEVCINGKKWWYLLATNGRFYNGEKDESC